MEWTGWQVEPSASVSNHPNFANAECCRSRLKMRCWAVSKRRSVVGVALLDLVPTCYGILWDSMRFWMSLNGIGRMSMCMYVYYVCKHHAKPCRSMYMYFWRPTFDCIAKSLLQSQERRHFELEEFELGTVLEKALALFFWPCLYIFWLCKIFEVSFMEALTPLTAILTREQVGRAEKIELAPWISHQASSAIDSS